MKYDPDIHHRRSIRLREYNYSTTGAYFVTICAQSRECLFGKINNGEMMLNAAGSMVDVWWQGVIDHFANVALDEYMIMPNHFHGIIILNDVAGRGESCIRPHLTSNYECPPIKVHGEHKVRPYGTDSGSVGRIIQAFKSMTTNAYIRGVNEHCWPPFPGRLWQRNYYERVIRDERELDAARKYIVENPVKWDLDRENPVNAS